MAIDIRGQEIRVGTRVAFNFSGRVAIGTIEKIGSSSYSIRRETHTKDYMGRAQNTLSKVKDISSLIAINEVDDIAKRSYEHRLQVLLDHDRAKAISDAMSTVAVLQLVRESWDLDDLRMALEDKYGDLGDYEAKLEQALEDLPAPVSDVLPFVQGQE